MSSRRIMHPRVASVADTASQAIKDAVFEAIRKPSFDASLPPLSDTTWAKLIGSRAHAERERLEFVGDALMYATIGTILYKQIPDGTPHMYTSVRDILHSNAVHSLVAEKLDILAVPDIVLRYLSDKDFGEGVSAATIKGRCQVKATADLFETVLGAYYMENGFGSLCDWVGDLYTPLISSAKKAFDTWLSLSRSKRERPCTISDVGVRIEDRHATAGRKKRKLEKQPTHRKSVPLGSRTNIKRMRHAPDDVRQVVASTSMKPLRSSRSTNGNHKLKLSPACTTRYSSPGKMRMPRSTRKTVAQSIPKAVFIDLTLSSDSSDDDMATPVRMPSTEAEGSTSSTSSRETGSSSRHTSRRERDDLRDEEELERMLTTHAGSNMDIESSDLEDRESVMRLASDYAHDYSDMDLGSDHSYSRIYS